MSGTQMRGVVSGGPGAGGRSGRWRRWVCVSAVAAVTGTTAVVAAPSVGAAEPVSLAQYGLAPLDDVALGGPVTASTSLENGQWGAAALTDGQPRSLADGRRGFTSDAQPTEWWGQSATIDLGRVQPVDTVTLFPRIAVGGEDRSVTGAGFPRDFTIAVSDDGQSWSTVGSFTGQSADGGGAVTYSVGGAASGRYVKVNVARLGKKAPGDAGFRLQLAEVRVSARGAGNVALNAAVSSPDALNGFGFAPAGLTDGQANPLPGKAYSSNPPYTTVFNGVGAPVVTVDLGSVQSVGRVVLHPRVAAAGDPADVTGAGFPRSFQVTVSKDGSSWQRVGVFDDQSADDGAPRSYDLGRVYDADPEYDFGARYVKLTVLGTGRVAGHGDDVPRLQLAEMQVFAPSTAVVSRGAAVDAGSALDFGAAGGFDRTQLTDGVIGSDARHGYTSDGHATPDGQEWVSVDLGARRAVRAVALYPRVAFGSEDPGVTGASFPKTFQIRVSDDGSSWALAGSYTGQQADDGKVRTYPTPGVTTARYVKVIATELGRPAPGDNGIHRLQLGELAVVGGSANLSGGTVYSGIANVPSTPFVKAWQIPLPATAPAGSTSANAIPVGHDGTRGNVGNPVRIFVAGNGATDQAISVLPGGGSGAQAVVTRPTSMPQTTAPQTWHLQFLGHVSTTGTMTNTLFTGLSAYYPRNIKQGLAIYKIVKYEADGTARCLDAFGGTGAPGTEVKLNQCDVTAVNQPNQLWTISYTTHGATLIDGETGSPFLLDGNMRAFPQWVNVRLQEHPNPTGRGYDGSGKSVIQSVASLAANNWYTEEATVLSAASNATGSSSILTLRAPDDPSVVQGNSMWTVLDLTKNIVNNAQEMYPGTDPSCNPNGCTG